MRDLQLTLPLRVQVGSRVRPRAGEPAVRRSDRRIGRIARGLWRRPLLTVFQNRQPEAAAAIVVAVVEHVALAIVIEHEGILDHL